MNKRFFTTVFISLIFIFGLLLSSEECRAQQGFHTGDTVTLVKTTHSPHKATIYSMVLPGLGQAYNKKYWKIGLVYAGFGVFTYFIVTNRNEYLKYRDSYNYANDSTLSPPTNDYWEKYTVAQLQDGRDYYRRNMELSMILTGFWYILNIVDAAVDAHLYEFDIDDNLSLEIDPPRPMIAPFQPITQGVPVGITFRLKF